MKKLLFPIIIFALLIAIAAYFVINDNKSTLNRKASKFSVSDVSKIRSISIKTKTDEFRVSLTGGIWRCNNRYIARDEAIDFLLQLSMRLEIKEPVSPEDVENVIVLFSIRSKEITIYNSDKVIRQYRVTEDTVKHLTYMMIPFSGKPFIMQATGLPSRIYMFYNTTDTWWRNRTILKYSPEQILSIEVKLPTQPSKSFKINNYGENKFGVKNMQTNKIMTNIEPKSLGTYLLGFENLQVEAYLDDKKLTESLLKQTAEYSIGIKDIYGNNLNISLFPKKTPLGLDLNHLYILFDNNDIALGKYIAFDPIMKDLDFFIK